MKIDKIIREHRKKTGFSQSQFAKLAGVGKTTVYDIEHGKTSIQWDSLLKVLKALNIKIAAKSGLNPEYTEIEI